MYLQQKSVHHILYYKQRGFVFQVSLHLYYNMWCTVPNTLKYFSLNRLLNVELLLRSLEGNINGSFTKNREDQ